MFKDGVVVKANYTEEETEATRENEKQSLLNFQDKTQLWDSQLRLGIISDENKQKN